MSDGIDRRIVELVDEPRETLDVEVKEWLDLSDASHKATLAKEIIALANHGGGFVVIGFAESDDGAFEPAENRPMDLSSWSQDAIHGIVSRYVEPSFQCSVIHHTASGSDDAFPVIGVPGGHRVPIVAKRGSPEAGDLIPRRVIIRRPGPNSEEPQSLEEWHQLFDRIVKNRQADLLDMFRTIMSGELPTTSTMPEPSREQELGQFVESAIQRWASRVNELPANSSPRFPHGYYDLSFAIDGGFQQSSLAQLNDVIRDAVRNHSGWPPFVTIYRPPLTPRPVDGAVESWFGVEADGSREDPAHSDFWRVSPEGLMFLLCGKIPSQRSGTIPGQVQTDARGIAQVLRSGWFSPVHMKSHESHAIRALLSSRKALQRKCIDLANEIRGLFRVFGHRLPPRVDQASFDDRVRPVIEADPALAHALLPLLDARDALFRAYKELDRRVKRAASQDDTCLRFMGIPGVGPIAALTFRAAVDDPSRFSRSRTVAAHFGLTPRRYQSGEVDNPGRISKVGDPDVRATLYAAANAMLMRAVAGSEIKSWGLRLMRRKGRRRAVVAVARKLAVVMHKMWVDGTEFRSRPMEGIA